MKLITSIAVLIAGLFAAISTAAAQADLAEVEWAKRQGVEERLQPLGVDLMGDKIDPNTGSLVFEHFDVSLPGNFDLPVAIGRRRSTGTLYVAAGVNSVEYGDWALLTPRITSLYAHAGLPGNGWDPFNCTYFNEPWPITVGGETIEGHDYWNGTSLDVPGRGGGKVLSGPINYQAPFGTNLVTTDNWALDCAASTDLIYATAPNGDVYKFDRRKVIYAMPMNVGVKGFGRSHAILLATEVTDVHGNWVKYEYDSSDRLTRIHASDGREINVYYNGTAKLIDHVTANGRTWNYQYTYTSTGYPKLTTVTRPDSRTWSFNLEGMYREVNACGGVADQTVTVTHPNGVTGTFVLSETRHGRTYVPGYQPLPPYSGCQPPYFIQSSFETMSIKSKTLVGAGYPSATWTYTYEESFGAHDGAGGLPDEKWTQMIDPTGVKTRYYYNRRWGDLENLLIKQEIYESASASTPMQTIEYDYVVESEIGSYFMLLENLAPSTKPRHITETTITHDTGDVFYTENTYDTTRTSPTYSYGFPTKVETWSTISTTKRVVDRVYAHDADDWILGLVDTETRNGKQFVDNDYNSIGQMTQTKRFGSLWRTYGYHATGDAKGTLRSVKNALNEEYLFENKKRGVPQLITYPDATTVSMTVDNNGWVESVTNQRSYTTGYEYNGMGWLTKVTPPTGNGATANTVITYAFTANGITQTLVKDRLTTTINYDGLQRPYLEHMEDTSLSGVESYMRTAYDALGRKTFESFPSPNSTASAGVDTDYDALGRVTEMSQTVAPFAATTYEYLVGNKTRMTDPRTYVTTTTRSAYGDHETGDPILIDAPLGADTVITYDIWGNKDTVTMGSSVTDYDYDASLRLSSVTDPDNYTSYIYYDAADRPIVNIDGAGRKTRTVYDAMGRPVKLIKAWEGSTDGTGSTLDCAAMRTAYNPATDYYQQCYQLTAYTATGQVDTVTDAGGNLTDYAYDALERLTNTYYPSTTTPGQASLSDYDEVVYDALGLPVTKRARSAAVIDYTHDALGRLVDRKVPGAPTHSANGRTVSHSFTYDAAGRRLTAVHDGVSLSFAYDAIGRIDWQKHNGAMAVSYAWDAANNLTRLTYPDGWAVDYVYDALNRVTDAVDNNGTGARTLASVGYDALSRRDALTYANGASARYGYSARGDLTCLDWNLTGAAPSACNAGAPEIAYDFTYNGAGQTLSETVSDPLLRWAPSASLTDTYAVNGLNQYTSVAGVSVTHDANGNLTADHRGQSYTYDAENVLRTASGLAGRASASYRYYADGARAEKTVNSASTQFYYMGGIGYLTEEDTEFAANQEIAEYDGATLLRRYVRLPGSVDEALLMIDMTLDGACTTTSYANCEVWAHQNRLGSTVATTDDAGAVADRYTYSPYGVSGGSSAGFPFRFTGQKLDPETQLYFYKARYYDPETGRFLQTDPIGYEDQMNLYAYVGNDPVNWNDPTGEFGLFGLAVGAVIGGGLELASELRANGGDLSKVDYGKVGKSAAIGGALGIIGGGATSLLRAGATGVLKAGIPKVAQVTVKVSDPLTRVVLAAEGAILAVADGVVADEVRAQKTGEEVSPATSAVKGVIENTVNAVSPVPGAGTAVVNGLEQLGEQLADEPKVEEEPR